jgi:uncharacterized protein YdhG (YjbR/CyaY superfamily)
MNENTKTIDEFIKSYPENVQKILQELRSTIHALAPEATEKIGYGIPTFQLKGKNLIHFSAYKTHIGLYPGPKTIADFEDELAEYETSKGTIQFPLAKPLPMELIKKIVEHRVKSLA